MKKYISLLIILFIAATVILGAVNAFKSDDSNEADVKSVNVKIHNFKNGELWKNKAKKLPNGDAIAGYVEYSSNSQYSKGTGVVPWYVGDGNEDIDPHHTKIIKTKFYFKNKSNGKIKTKTVKGDKTKLIKGYVPFKAKVWYKEF